MMPRQITVYKCNICGKQYYSENEACKCESEHAKPIGLKDHNYKYEDYRMWDHYPSYVIVQMSNGKDCQYNFVNEIKW